MFNEYDIVRAKRNINKNVPKGSEGTILIIYPSTPAQYEVEFMDKEGNTMDVLTVKENDVEITN